MNQLLSITNKTAQHKCHQRRHFGNSFPEFGETHISVLGCERRPFSPSIMSRSCFAPFPVCVYKFSSHYLNNLIFIDNNLGPLARESPCTSSKNTWGWDAAVLCACEIRVTCMLGTVYRFGFRLVINRTPTKQRPVDVKACSDGETRVSDSILLFLPC
jgi:hypothetical protein